MFSRDKQGWQFTVRQSDHSFEIEFRMAKVANFPLEDGDPIEIAVVTRLETTVKAAEPGDSIPVCAHVDRDEVQSLLDALWEDGFRPTGWADSATINKTHDAVMKIAEKLDVDLNEEETD